MFEYWQYFMSCIEARGDKPKEMFIAKRDFDMMNKDLPNPVEINEDTKIFGVPATILDEHGFEINKRRKELFGIWQIEFPDGKTMEVLVAKVSS